MRQKQHFQEIARWLLSFLSIFFCFFFVSSIEKRNSIREFFRNRAKQFSENLKKKKVLNFSISCKSKKFREKNRIFFSRNGIIFSGGPLGGFIKVAWGSSQSFKDLENRPWGEISGGFHNHFDVTSGSNKPHTPSPVNPPSWLQIMGCMPKFYSLSMS